MITITLENIKTLVFSGDIHGEFETIVYKLNNYTETVLIVCGDIGMGFHRGNYYICEIQTNSPDTRLYSCRSYWNRKRAMYRRSSIH